MKEKLIQLFIDSRNKFWNESDCDHTELSEEDKKRNDECDKKLADVTIKLFESQ